MIKVTNAQKLLDQFKQIQQMSRKHLEAHCKNLARLRENFEGRIDSWVAITEKRAREMEQLELKIKRLQKELALQKILRKATEAIEGATLALTEEI